jgi:hypothetical protein
MSDNKLACSLFFAKTDPGDAECRDYKCKICSIVRKANKSGGYTNLIELLKEKHPKWKDVVARARRRLWYPDGVSQGGVLLVV